MTTTEPTFEKWAETAPIGSLSPNDEYTKMLDENGDAQHVQVWHTEGGHKCILWDNQWLYYNPTVTDDQIPWMPYTEITNPAFRRHEEDHGPPRFDLSLAEGRRSFRQWLRTVLEESWSTWSTPETLRDLSFEEYFEPYLFAGYLQNSADHPHDPIVRPTERARGIYREIRDETARQFQEQ